MWMAGSAHRAGRIERCMMFARVIRAGAFPASGCGTARAQAKTTGDIAGATLSRISPFTTCSPRKL